MLSYVLLVSVVLLKLTTAYDAAIAEEEANVDARNIEWSWSWGPFSWQLNSPGGNVKNGQSISVNAGSPQILNNIKAGRRKRYVDMNDSDQEIRSSGSQSNNGGGNVNGGSSIFAGLLNPSVLNNIKAGRRKRYVDMNDSDQEIRSSGSQSNNGGGNVNGGSSIFAGLLNPSVLNNIKAGRRKRYVDMNDSDQEIRSSGSQSNNGGGNVNGGSSIFAGLLNPSVLNNIKAGRRKRYVDMNDSDQEIRSSGSQSNNGGGNVNGGSSIFGSVLNPSVGNNLKLGKRKRYVNSDDYDQDMRSSGSQSNNGGGNVGGGGSSIFGSVLNPSVLNNLKLGKRKRYVNSDDYDQEMRSSGSQSNSGGGNVSGGGSSIFGSLLNPSVGNNLKLGKRKRYVNSDDYDQEMRSSGSQSNSGGGNVSGGGSSIFGSLLNPSVGNNLKLGKRKRYVNSDDYDQEMRSSGSQSNNGGGNVGGGGSSIFGSVLNPSVGNNLKLGKRKRYVNSDDYDQEMRSSGSQSNNGGGNVGGGGSSIFGSVLNPSVGNNLKLGKRKRYVNSDDYDQEMRSSGSQSNSGGGNVSGGGSSIFGSLLNPSVGNNLKLGKRKRYVNSDDYDQEMRSSGSQNNNGGGNVSGGGSSIFGSLLNPSVGNNLKLGKRK